MPKRRMSEGDKNRKEIDNIARQIESKTKELEKLRSRRCYLFLGSEITTSIVEDVFDDLRKNYSDCNGKLDVIVDSEGGDINAAFNMSTLFRRFGREELVFLVPRWAKSATTLLVCGGNEILMAPIAELGPLDPQITQLNPLEKRLEQFSPLHIESTLDLIREEFENGNKHLAEKLLERLQFPLTLGSFLKSLEIGEQYLMKLLSSRMLKEDNKKAGTAARKLTRGYADHAYCISCDEARDIGLKVNELKGSELDLVWEIYKLYDKKRELEKEIREKEVVAMIKELPPEIIENLPEELKEVKKKERGEGK